MRKAVKLLGKAALITSCSLFAGNAFGATPNDVVVNHLAKVTPYCGTKPIKIALVDGYGGDTWRKIALATLKYDAAKCNNIKDIAYTNAGGSPQAYNAAINSYTAQGFNIIISFTDFGDASIPAFRSAFRAGVTVVPYMGKLNGKAGRDYSVNVYQDSVAIGKHMGEWLGKALHGHGNVLFIGGAAGATSSTQFMEGFKEGVAKYPGLKLLDKNYLVTNWNPADAQKAVAGAIAKYPKIDGIAADFGEDARAAINEFQESGVKVPAVASVATDNQLDCKYVDALKKGKAWPFLALDGTTGMVTYALQHALASYNKIPDHNPIALRPYVFANSLKGIKPKCSTAAPPDADLSSYLSKKKLYSLFK